jgi:ferrochelatase
MPIIASEPPPSPSGRNRVGVALVNLGTPPAPTAPALRRYLAEFLGDRRVVELPRILWLPILHGIILNTRPRKSAAKYAKIWLQDEPLGSPLAVHTERQAKLLRGLLGATGQGEVEVAWAMRYGHPAVAEVLDQLLQRGCGRILLLPLYPQYAASTTASALDAVADWLKQRRNLPQLRFVRDFHRDGRYIAALAQGINAAWMRTGRPDRLIMSFHGLPQRSVALGDPYYRECLDTGTLLAQALGLNADAYQITFQSRFGAARWLQPYTQATLEKLAREGIGRVDVICPGFIADCLETLEEIAIECRAAFMAAGGREFNYLPCLNESDAWIAALAGLVRDNLGDWLATSPTT